ncbi:unnamed protein product [Penicillium nalgiovense]|uniref:GDP-mannose transporter n=2 Tax=Penicillium nalgiovense TaxID=60175 RepID=A0A9W4MMD5_PENNA|nr:unnamed protein product [Penicillium nalgiovense]CAG7966217.1 unnamed protein product [Penicillium nalgiovense]CAG7970045.1 unnamed protein product [Penicillium nalgiovense]CAG7970971.1 unnamed protein product [Penicillium nalgiovense]CAG7974629.1 unnamed protein product [Penicillium nalgiovense]
MFTLRELRSKLKEAERWSRNYFRSDTEELNLLEKADNSDQSLDPSDNEDKAPGKLRLVLCITTNIVSTVSIVFTNKYIFSNETLRNCQMAFASYHFFITGLTLWVLSRPFCGVFVAKSVSIHRNIHLIVLMCAQVILQNISLANSSIIFHQLVRLLLTPATALLSFLLYRSVIPKTSILPMIVLCGGVGIVFWSDSYSTNTAVATSSKGVICAFTGVIVSAYYTSLVGSYQRKLQVNSMQLLLNQAPMGASLLLCMVPFLDAPPTTTVLSPSLYIAILASGLFACLVNVSQFAVIDAVGPVSSTVIGHLKTCTIVGLGWFLSDRSVSKQSVVGILMALLGMGWYMAAILQGRR